MNIGKKLSFSFAVVLLLALAVGLIGMVELSSLKNSYQSLIDDRVGKIMHVKDLKYIAADQTKNVRGYLLTGSAQQWDAYMSQRAAFASVMSALESTLQTEESKRLAGRLVEMEAQYAQVVAEIATYKQRNDVQTYTRLVEEKCVPMALALAATADELEQYQRSLLEQSKTELAAKVGEIQTVLLATLLTALAVGMVLAYIITRMISRPVVQVARSAKQIAEGDLTGADLLVRQRDEIGEMARDFNTMKKQLRTLMQSIHRNAQEVAGASRDLSSGAEQATQGSNQIAEAIQDISGSATGQLDRIQENQHAMQESSEGLQRIAQSAAITAESSEQAMVQAEQGSSLLGDTIGQMRQVNAMIEESAAVIYELGEQSKQIDKITQFIRDIAQQTNLLSLNASIEAARAGEQGKGFAVVAEEVKKLSEQSGQASEQIAKGITRMVGTIAKAVDSMKQGSGALQEGTRLMDRTGEAFEVVYKSIRIVAEQSQEVSAATEELSAVTDQLLTSETQLVGLSGAITAESQNVAAVCEEQLASMEEMSASAEALNRMAAELMAEIERFRFEESGAAAAAAGRSQRAYRSVPALHTAS